MFHWTSFIFIYSIVFIISAYWYMFHMLLSLLALWHKYILYLIYLEFRHSYIPKVLWTIKLVVFYWRIHLWIIGFPHMHVHMNFIPTAHDHDHDLPFCHLHQVHTLDLHHLPLNYSSPPPEIPPDFISMLWTSSGLSFCPPFLSTYEPPELSYCARRPTHIISQRDLLFYSATFVHHTVCYTLSTLLLHSSHHIAYHTFVYTLSTPFVHFLATLWVYFLYTFPALLAGLWYTPPTLFLHLCTLWLHPCHSSLYVHFTFFPTPSLLYSGCSLSFFTLFHTCLTLCLSTFWMHMCCSLPTIITTLPLLSHTFLPHFATRKCTTLVALWYTQLGVYLKACPKHECVYLCLLSMPLQIASPTLANSIIFSFTTFGGTSSVYFCLHCGVQHGLEIAVPCTPQTPCATTPCTLQNISKIASPTSKNSIIFPLATFDGMASVCFHLHHGAWPQNCCTACPQKPPPPPPHAPNHYATHLPNSPHHHAIHFPGGPECTKNVGEGIARVYGKV